MKTKAFIHYLNKNSTIGGIEVYASRLASLLQNSGFENHFLFKNEDTFPRPLTQDSHLNWQNLKHLDTSSTNIICHHLPDEKDLERMKGFSKSYFAHDHFSYCVRQHKYHLLGRKACHLSAGLKCLVCTMGLQKVDGKLSLINPAEPFKRLKILKSFERILVLSNTIRDYLILNGISNNKIFSAPVLSGVAPTNNFKKKDKSRNALFLGQLVFGKGVSQMPSIAQKCPEWNFKIAGQGNLYDSIKQQTQNISNTEVTGFLNEIQMEETFQWADILVMPTYWQEPFGLVGLEANSRNIPVLAYNTGGTSQWLQDGVNGFLLPWNEQKVLIDRLHYLNENQSALDKLKSNCGIYAKNFLKDSQKSIENLWIN